MIKKILIANRGEIAVRIVRACSEMGIKSVAVYAEADRYSLHVKKADEAYSLGPDTVAGYLNVHRLVNLAKEAGCDALHPGYGFLSENPELSAACARRKIQFIGPDETTIKKMGDKIQARKAMIDANIPVTPGSESSLADLDEAVNFANNIGYPVMLKATAGGGGRGIRRCNNLAELTKNYDRVISEANKAFGSTDIFIEKCIDNSRHIEVQILADKHGNVVHLFERDCSIQRRHQKLIEIAPSPQITEQQRVYLGDLAVRAAKSVNYVNAGTVEFLMTEDNQFYFMEMNTRLQVEHPITESITGIDIVQEQIRIASGLNLTYQQHEIKMRGYAIEFRINAEDPQNDFLPSFGKISRYFATGGPGVRTDGSIYTGYVIPPYYDSMCAKLIIWALNWDSVLDRSQRALKDIVLHGVKTTIPYQLEILKSAEFQMGKFNTGFVEAHPELNKYSVKRSNRDVAAAVATAVAASMGL
ncbi:Pyruvate carboxylase subunit A [hydrothermal vent metagenome]|uniref:Pyruvate carboxylase subunit A n=1 Tax=hydrothermal vent metagenome TaxID=652676 RepID=A0A3B1AGY4_9ZZZZ